MPSPSSGAALPLGVALPTQITFGNEQIKHSLIFTALDSGNFDYMGSLGALLQLKPFLTVYAGKLDTDRMQLRDETLD